MMAAGVMRILKSYYFQILAAALIVATILLMWFGYRATSEWQRSTRQVVDRRTIEVLYLMVTALTRDMRAVQSQVLPQLGPMDNYSGVYEVADEAARAFARFPYPDSFFSWKAGGDDKGVLHVFNRADRPPSWYKGNIGIAEFPTTLLKDPPELADMVHLLGKQAALRTRAILFETTIKGEPYQVIARPVYVAPSRTTLQGVVGFTVNINWVRAHYFSELTAELSRVVEGRRSMALEIFDENGSLVTSNRPAGSIQPGQQTSVRERKFPLLFFDQVLENVLDNAIRYSNGTRHLNISASASNTEVTLRIADKGRGIPPDEAPHVFEKFFRGHDVTSGGSGLGLAIAQRIMKDHHGQVRLESVPGIGTVAEILLPIEKRESHP